MGGCVEVVVGRQNAKVIEIISSTALVSIHILELANAIKSGDLFEGQL